MRKRTEILNVIKKDMPFLKYSKDLIEVIFNYLKIFDLEQGTNNCKIFFALYIEEKRKPYYKIAMENFVDLKTLDRYRIRYNNLATKLIISDLKISPYINKLNFKL